MITHTHTRTSPRGQKGMALITSMLLLIVMTIMALSMFRSYGTEERLAGNTRDKQRAINAAISAQQYAEYMLASGNAPASGICPATVLPSGVEVCTNSPGPSFTSIPWSTGVTYAAFTATTVNGMKNVVSTTGTPDAPGLNESASYYKAPIFYITDLGANAGQPPGEVYQVDALGYGGTQNTVAVVESTFVVGLNTPQNLGNP